MPSLGSEQRWPLRFDGHGFEVQRMKTQLGIDMRVSLSVSAEWLEAFDRWRGQQLVKPSRSAVIAAAVELFGAGLTMRQIAPNGRIICASPDYISRNGEPAEAKMARSLRRARRSAGRDAAGQLRPDLEAYASEIVKGAVIKP
jgi:hypothetical protein